MIEENGDDDKDDGNSSKNETLFEDGEKSRSVGERLRYE